MSNIAQNLVDTAAAHPQAPAVKLDDGVLTYEQLDDMRAELSTADGRD